MFTSLTWTEYYNVVSEVVVRLVEDAGANIDRWIELLKRVSDLTPGDRQVVLTALKQRIEADGFDDGGRVKIWEELRAQIAQHREFATAKWALSQEELAKIDEICVALQPSAPLQRHVWLFQSWRPPLPDRVPRSDHPAYDSALDECRKEAVAEIDSSGGLDALYQLAREATEAWWVGIAIADATGDKYRDQLLPLLGVESATQADLSGGYVARQFRQAGWQWIDSLIDGTAATNATQRGTLLLKTSDHPRSWQRADQLGEDVAQEFWKRFQPVGLGHDFPHAVYVAERLMGAGRNAAALFLIELYMKRDDADVGRLLELAASALETLLITEDPEIGSLRQYGFRQLFDLFYDHREALGWERIARLEWAYLPALGFQARPKMLNDLLARDETFFVTVVSAICWPASAKERPAASAEQTSRATNAYTLLSEWSVLPGTQADGSIDSAALQEWVLRASNALREADRLTIGLQQIGQVLAKAPADGDGTWPCTSVRDLLEAQCNKQLEKGFYIGTYNKRGVVSRSLDGGGIQERVLAAKYRTDASVCADQWPRTAAVLRALADDYDREGRREDGSAERFLGGLDE